MKHKDMMNFLIKHKACEEGMEWIKSSNIKTFEELWSKCHRSDWMLWLLDKLGYCSKKQLVLYACWCTRNTKLVAGRTTWDLLTDERSRKAVEVSELFVEGKATQEEIEAAWSAAWSAAESAAESARSAWSAAESAAWSAAESAAESARSAWSAAESAWSAAWSAAESAAWSAAWSAAESAWSAAESAAWSAAWSAAESAAWSQQADRLREMIPNPFEEIK